MTPSKVSWLILGPLFLALGVCMPALSAAPNTPLYDRVAAMSDEELLSVFNECGRATYADAKKRSALGVTQITRYSADIYQGGAFAAGSRARGMETAEDRVKRFRGMPKPETERPFASPGEYLNTEYYYLVVKDNIFTGLSREVERFSCYLGDDIRPREL